MKLDFDVRPMCYVSGPYTMGDPVENVRAAILVADELNETGLVTCHVPHLNHLWHLVAPHEPDYWYAYDLAMLNRCQMLYRIEGKSTGAEREWLYAWTKWIPVYTDREKLLAYAEAWRPGVVLTSP